MLVSQIITNIQNTLKDTGVYATDTFVLDVVNDGYVLVSVLSLFDERRGSVSVSGARNMVWLPTVDSAEMLGVAYVANTASGSRVSPVRLDQLELYTQEWEGVVDGADVDYYTTLSPYHHAEAMLWCVPVSTSGTVGLTVVGPCVPTALTAASTPRLPEEFQDILYYYGLFGVFVAEPGRAEDAAGAYKVFVERVNMLIENLKSRFPSWQGFRPYPIEFKYTSVMRYQQKQPAQTEGQTNASE